MKTETYQAVTDRIVAMIEAGTPPWRKSWTAGAPAAGEAVLMQRPLRSNGVPYTGVNVLNLWCAAQARGLTGRHWFTYKGAQEVGGQVRKGAKGELAFYVGRTTKTVEGEGGQDEERSISFLKCYVVFNQDEIDNLPARYTATPAAPVTPEATSQRNQAVDSFVATAGVHLSHGGDRAYYQPSIDAVRMPHLAQFNSAESYYATLLHECVHWTGHKDRMARDFSGRFGDDSYAAEELVAELGAAFLCADLAVSNEPRQDHASYLAHWLRVLKADNRAIFTAAAKADQAATFLHAAQDQAEAIELAEAA